MYTRMVLGVKVCQVSSIDLELDRLLAVKFVRPESASSPITKPVGRKNCCWGKWDNFLLFWCFLSRIGPSSDDGWVSIISVVQRFILSFHCFCMSCVILDSDFHMVFGCALEN
ncbi:hypothetical protein RchiOBHm_Chr5g0036651 [Rosa chinensis]|uniref:Uncharacterized protein n=1 Tax=Rosa chinensis TaxID=74649 RepID=A0A2P6QBI7_ROSCH|nr:hypothetical protein RchiOBHm_Chr5g0036651 [Rosa chinensis]